MNNSSINSLGKIKCRHLEIFQCIAYFIASPDILGKV